MVSDYIFLCLVAIALHCGYVSGANKNSCLKGDCGFDSDNFIDGRQKSALDSSLEREPSKFSANSAFTLVTGLFDIARGDWKHFRRSYDEYLSYMVPILQLDVNMIIFIQAKGLQHVQKYRKNLEARTVVKRLEISDMENYKFKSTIGRIMANEAGGDSKTHPEAFSPLYNIVTNSKHYLMHLAVEEDPFKTPYFFWLDSGYGHLEAEIPRPGSQWAPANLFARGDQVTFIQLADVSLRDWTLVQIYRQSIEAFINGCFFGGSRETVQEYYRLHQSVFEELLDQQVTDDDQTIVFAAYKKRPELFNMVLGDWYSVFQLFH